ncbi:MAG: hypothetical protein ABGX70_06015 [Psychrobacter sp.]|uniref:hypothetical protein n=1 Tax=Cobetia sp. TaxID=1873876 RepID=UPI0032426D7C
MRRFRWFYAEWPLDIRTLSKRLKLRTFSPEVGHGFIIDRVRDDFLEAKYIEQVEYTDIIIDPFGNELNFERIEFRQTLFRVTKDGPGLELIDAPRSVQPLMNRLSEAVDFEVAINSISVNPLSWLKGFENLCGGHLEVNSLQIGALEIEPGINAKIVLKGTRDVQSASSSLTNEKKHKIEKIQLQLQQPYKGAVILSASGSVTIGSESIADQLIQPLRASLAEAMQSHKSTP